MRIRSTEKDENSQIVMGAVWEAVGPFPSGMREHPLTSSPLAAFPHDSHPNPTLDPDIDFAFRPYSTQETFPSALGPGGRVGWSTFRGDRDGWVSVSYPDVRWDQLRRDRGWASLQFQSVLRTTMVVPPPRPLLYSDSHLTSIRVELVHGTEFAFVPMDKNTAREMSPTKWYNGDVYGFANTPSGARIDPHTENRSHRHDRGSNFVRSIVLPPGKYTVLVRAMYEIRMFGDPGPKAPPTIHFLFRADLADQGTGFDTKGELWEVVEGLRVVPDILDGRVMGDWISVPIRLDALAQDGLKVVCVGVGGQMGEVLEVRLPSGPISICPGQIRPISIKIDQKANNTSASDFGASLHITFHLEYRGKNHLLHWAHQLKHVALDSSLPFTITFASPPDPKSPEDGEPALISYAAAVPPKIPLSSNTATKPPVLLGLHGAGVDVQNPFWAAAIPSVAGMWAVLPTGKNEWGEDWHGGSMADVWAARAALPGLVARVGVEISDRTLLVGHSNGGQGAWHLAARYPDRIVGVIAASGWLKIQDYVPYTSLTSTHYADPALMGILQSSLSAYNNDLYASNLARLPVLAIHGSEDDNVPPRHSREHVALIQSWEHDNSNSTKKLVEVPKKGHWWDDVLKQPEVYAFIDSVTKVPSLGSDWEVDRQAGFTLTTANPDESGGRSGVRILELEVPGRLARLDVNAPQWDREPRGEKGMFHGTNVRRFSFQPTQGRSMAVMKSIKNGSWAKEVASSQTDRIRRYGPMIRVLCTNGPMRLVVDTSNHSLVPVAMRYAHDLYVFHRIAVDIVSAEEALAALDVTRAGTTGGGGGGGGNIVSIGRPDQNVYTAHLLEQSPVPLSFPSSGNIDLAGRTIFERGTGVIALHPHPTSLTGVAVIVAGNDDEGLSLAARLLPLRTGVPVPDWTVIGPRSRWQAAGGIIGAGFWGAEWQYSECMSWMDRQ